MKKFEEKPCLIIGRNLRSFIKPSVIHDQEEIVFFRDLALFNLEFPWFTIIVIDNFWFSLLF